MAFDPAALNARYCLSAFDDGGVLLDLQTGGYFQVNATGAWLLERTLAQGIEAAARAGADRWRVSAETVAADIERMLAPQGDLPIKPTEGPVTFEATDDSITLLWEGHPAIEASASGPLSPAQGASGPLSPAQGASGPLSPAQAGERVRVRGRPAPVLRLLEAGQGNAAPFVHMILPKAAALVGLDVLHASAVQIDGAVIAFSGVSGAGKSTTAAAVIAAGGRKLVEDILVLSPDRAALVVGAEQRFIDWKAHASAALQKGETADLSEPRGFDQGTDIPLDAVLFLDANRRTGDRFDLHRLSHAETAVAVLENAFVGSVTPAAWRRHLATAAKIAASARGYRATAPAGLVALHQDAKGLYKTISAS